MSEIFDIKKIKPEKDDRYFVDTNVWFWFTYCGSNQFAGRAPSDYQLRDYPAFIEKILNIGAKIYTCPLIYTELANLIERTEYEEYLVTKGLEKQGFSRKKFRAIPDARRKVLNEIQSAWKVICRIAPQCLELTLNLETTHATHNFMSTSMLDPYDAIFIHFINSHQISMLISDDGDMMTANIPQIFTANRNYIT